jgi:F-type H+-transporting ATPase subunit b
VPAQKQPTTSEQATPVQQPAADASQGTPSQELAQESREAAGEEKNAQFKYSPSVRWVARLTGLSPIAAYWLLLSLNFAAVAILIAAFAKSKLPSFFRTRSETIHMSMEEARRTSADAQSRLREIESRLARIDTEINEMRAAAERQGQQEEERIRGSAEEDRVKILAAVDQEIAAAQRVAERNLKAYAAALAVEIAERRIKIDPETDRRLVRQFAHDFSADGLPDQPAGTRRFGSADGSA